MKKTYKLKRFIFFLFVIIIQIFVLNNIQLSGYINPYYYIIFILTIPAHTSKGFFLIQSFVIGFVIDIFSNSYGIHSFACVLGSYALLILKNRSNNLKDVEGNVITTDLPMNKFIFISMIFIFTHHFSLFFLDTFSYQYIFKLMTTTLLSSIFTLILILTHKIFTTSKKWSGMIYMHTENIQL